ncbi:hypothetical protein [Pseudomonas sp. D2002]|uniref:hypothetical protein n=1 Tax=Pseudomonas sp. D2002 TaxID=2726980 RepID=UPI0015A24F1B|nr:hypothetical protein [Pseudomonas sp. D2002]
MTGISLNLPEAMDVLRDYIEHEQALTAQIELAVKEADQGNFATDDQVAGMRAGE